MFLCLTIITAKLTRKRQDIRHDKIKQVYVTLKETSFRFQDFRDESSHCSKSKFSSIFVLLSLKTGKIGCKKLI